MSEKYVCTLTPELKVKAREELKEKEEWRSRDIQALRDLIIKNKGKLNVVKIFLYLTYRSFSLTISKQCIILSLHQKLGSWDGSFLLTNINNNKDLPTNLQRLVVSQ